MIYNIDVVLIEPGTVKTPIINKFADQVARFQETDYAPVFQKLTAAVDERRTSAMPVALVSQTIFKAISSPRPKTRYVLARNWLIGWMLPRWLPDRWFDKLVAKQLGF